MHKTSRTPNAKVAIREGMADVARWAWRKTIPTAKTTPAASAATMAAAPSRPVRYAQVGRGVLRNLLRVPFSRPRVIPIMMFTKAALRTANDAIAGVRNCATPILPSDWSVISGVTRFNAMSSISGMMMLMKGPIGLRASRTN